MLKAILYDLDGTLANTDPLHYQIWYDLLKEFGLEIDETFYKNRLSGRLNPAIIEDLLPQLSPQEAEEFAEHKEALFRQRVTTLPATPGLHLLMAWAVEQGLKQAVVTNAPSQNAWFMLDALHLRDCFDRVIIAQDIGIGKPDPAPYQWALKDFGITATEAIAFEDSPSGMRSAVAAGIATVGITTTQEPSLLHNLGAMLTIEDFTQSALWTWLEERVR
ncbi:MAG: HAD-IA family hydrolase [Scytolyngbya sp. HA4215-MV1]|jgi:HAD superfamily hydrolase (TIGR01509 family)|nr:HAD-IA family hydrolase [Scytolyngbya sp. HA4215-MV1]